jgi:hypothetical protein
MRRPRPRIILCIESQLMPLETLDAEFCRWEGHANHLVDDAHAHRPDHCSQVFRTLVATVAAVCDDYGGLALPFMVQVVDGVLELGGDTPVALGGDEDEGVQIGYAPRPDAGMFVGVLLGRLDLLGDARFVEKR